MSKSILNIYYRETLDKVDSYEEYLSSMSITLDTQLWKKSLSANNKSAYQEYLNEYPKGNYCDEAQFNINAFNVINERERKLALDKEKEAWELVCKKDQTWSYHQYLDKYPNGIYTTDAKLRIVSFEKYLSDFEELIHLDNIRINYEYGYTNLILYSSLDMTIEELKEAKFLDISRNSLAELPFAISYLINLEELIITRNNLIALPEWIGNLTKLKKLNLDDNNINEYPRNMSNLINIEELYLGSLNIKEVPLWVKELKKLKELMLWHNQNLTKLPLWIDSMEYLDSLWISNTKIDNLSSFKNLSKRESLHINATNLDISYLKKIELQAIFKTKIRIFM